MPPLVRYARTTISRAATRVWAIHGLCAVVLCVAVVGAAHAERLLVETNSLTALGQAVRVYVHSVDMPAGAVLPLPAVMPGEAPLGPLSVTHDGSAFLSTVDLQGALAYGERGIAYTSRLHAAPFRMVASQASTRDPSWDLVGNTLADDASGALLLQLESRIGVDGIHEGRLTVYRVAEPEPLPGHLPRPLAPALHRVLPAPPVAAAAMDGLNRVAVLGHGAFGSGSWLQVLDVTTGEVLLDEPALTDPEGLTEAEPGAIAVSQDGVLLYAVTCGYASDSAAGDPVSWVRVYEADTLQPIGAPLEVPGHIRPGEPALEIDAAGGVWLATQWAVAGFAHLSHAKIAGGALVRDVAHSFKTTHAVRVAPNPAGDGAFVAIGAQLERWDGAGTMMSRTTFASPIQVLRWSDAGVYAGEAGRLHDVDAETGESRSVVQFQSGHVADLVVVPPSLVPEVDVDGDGVGAFPERDQGTNPVDPDTDLDGIPDGIDVEPFRKSPLLRTPGSLVFRGESVGRDVKSLPLEAYGGVSSVFRIVVPEPFSSWLRVAPESGRTPERVLVGIDPLHYVPSPTAVAHGWFEVHLDGLEAETTASLSPQRVEVHVLPKPTGARRVLWLWPDGGAEHLRHASDPRGFKALADLLSGAPYYFSHEEFVGPFSGPLAPYSVVAIGTGVSARGAVNPHALLEYVARGGSLLFLGEHAPEIAAENLQWLRPLGLTINPAQRVDGLFAADGGGLLRSWGRVSIRGGCAIAVAPPYEAVVEGTEDAGFAVFGARSYGRGRVAALAAATPLETPNLNGENRQFAGDLFSWLADAGYDVADRDGDGLPDWQEDANGNRSIDMGETNADRADTDGDGLPDGYEDANWNGTWDEGETNPRLTDSDGDGIFDGADQEPVPSPGTAMIAQVFPSTGPAEGGNAVTIGGEHLPVDCTVWFGTRQSPQVAPLGPHELQVQAPPAVSPGPVDIRLEDGAGATIVEASNAYTYQQQTHLHAMLHTAEIMKIQDGLYRGTTSIVLEGPSVDLRRVRVFLRADPLQAVTWGEAVPGQATKELGRRVAAVPLRQGLLAIDLHDNPGHRVPLPGEIAVVTWEARLEHPEDALSLRIDQVFARARSGELLPTSVGDAIYPLERAARPRRAEE